MTDDAIPGGPFRKGDPRINRKGRPRTFDALRTLAQQIAHEEAKQAGQPIVIDGHVVTVTEAILRQWAASKDPRLQMHFIEVAFGKVPDNIDITTNGEKIKMIEVVSRDADENPDGNS